MDRTTARDTPRRPQWSAARVLRSIPLFDQAVVDAVKLWEFTPNLVNGMPVPVTMPVTVNSTLD